MEKSAWTLVDEAGKKLSLVTIQCRLFPGVAVVLHPGYELGMVRGVDAGYIIRPVRDHVVITSYSIHYTKLYEQIMTMQPANSPRFASTMTEMTTGIPAAHRV